MKELNQTKQSIKDIDDGTTHFIYRKGIQNELYKRNMENNAKSNKRVCFLDRMEAKKKAMDGKSSALKVQSGYLDRLRKHKNVEFSQLER